MQKHKKTQKNTKENKTNKKKILKTKKKKTPTATTKLMQEGNLIRLMGKEVIYVPFDSRKSEANVLIEPDKSESKEKENETKKKIDLLRTKCFSDFMAKMWRMFYLFFKGKSFHFNHFPPLTKKSVEHIFVETAAEYYVQFVPKSEKQNRLLLFCFSEHYHNRSVLINPDSKDVWIVGIKTDELLFKGSIFECFCDVNCLHIRDTLVFAGQNVMEQHLLVRFAYAEFLVASSCIEENNLVINLIPTLSLLKGAARILNNRGRNLDILLVPGVVSSLKTLCVYEIKETISAQVIALPTINSNKQKIVGGYTIEKDRSNEIRISENKTGKTTEGKECKEEKCQLRTLVAINSFVCTNLDCDSPCLVEVHKKKENQWQFFRVLKVAPPLLALVPELDNGTDVDLISQLTSTHQLEKKLLEWDHDDFVTFLRSIA